MEGSSGGGVLAPSEWGNTGHSGRESFAPIGGSAVAHCCPHVPHQNGHLTPLHYAAMEGHTAVVELLLGAGSDPQLKDYVSGIC